MTYNTMIYGKLLAETVPGVIGEEKGYGRIESIFNGLIDKGEETLSPDEARLFELLAKLLEEFEADALERIPDVSPADALRFLMDQNDLKQTDLEEKQSSVPERDITAHWVAPRQGANRCLVSNVGLRSKLAAPYAIEFIPYRGIKSRTVH